MIKSTGLVDGTFQLVPIDIEPELPNPDVADDAQISTSNPIAEIYTLDPEGKSFPTWSFTYDFMIPDDAPATIEISAMDQGMFTLLWNGIEIPDADLLTSSDSKSIAIVPCLPPPPTCDVGMLLWQNDIVVNADGSVETDVSFETGSTNMYEIYNSSTLPEAFTGPVLVQVNEIVAWDGFADRRTEGDQPNERFKVVFKRNGILVFESPWSGGLTHDSLTTGALSAEWVSPQGWSGPLVDIQGGVDQILLIHWSGPVPMGGQPNPGTNPNTVVPASVCIRYEAGILPIQLLSFGATPVDEQKVMVDWATASEINNSYFEVERSTDGLNFEVIGMQQGAGISAQRIDYYFIDHTPYLGANYYRLKSVDYDGGFDYSHVAIVNFAATLPTAAHLYPNPARSVLNYELKVPADETSSIEIIDVLGRAIYADKIDHGKALFHRKSIDVSYLTPGIYYFRVRRDNLTEIIPFSVIN